MQYTYNKTKKFQFVFLLPVVGLILLFSGCDQTSTGLIELEGEKIKYYENVDNSELQLTDQSLLIGAEAMKIAIQNPEFLVEVYKSLKFYDKQAHEYDMNRFAAVSIAELESDDALHRRNENFSKLTASKSSKIFKNSLSKAIMSLPQNGLDSEDIHKFYIEDLVNLYMPNFELWDGKEIPTIAWHTLDEEEEEAPGFEPVIDPITSHVIDWKVVKTNETYGKEKPVLIVMPGRSFSYDPAEIETVMNPNGKITLEYKEKTAYEESSSNNERNELNEITSSELDYHIPPEMDYESMEVQLGWMMLSGYPCGWLCSGRTVRFGHQEAYQNFTNSPIMVKTSVTKNKVPKNKRNEWRRLYSPLDDDWAPWQTSKPIAISIERGGVPGITVLQGILSVIATIAGGDPSTGELISTIVGTLHDFESNNENRDQFYDGIMNRHTFKSGNTINGGHGLMEGFRVRRVDNNDGGIIRYTLPHIVHPK